MSGLPQVNLLPPEVKAARGLVNTKRWLAVGLARGARLHRLVYVFAILSRGVAENDLDEGDGADRRLQQESDKYAEVPDVLANLDRAESARTTRHVERDLLWAQYLDAITAVMPAERQHRLVLRDRMSPWTPIDCRGATPRRCRSGHDHLHGRAAALPDEAAWMDALDGIPNFANPTFIVRDR